MVEPENESEARDRHLRELEGKNVQNYSVLLAAWIQTRMERDKTIVALSAAAIGLLVTLLTTKGVPRWWLLLPYTTAFVGFAVSIGTALAIYQKNSEKIESDMRGSGDPKYRFIDLAPYDRAAIIGFLVGAISVIVIGLSSATLSYLTTRESMSDPKIETTAAPKPEEVRSLQGIEALKPQHPDTAPSAVETGTPPTESTPAESVETE